MADDVGVTHWKYGGKDGEYSTHKLTTITSATLPSVPSTEFEGMRSYEVLDDFDYFVQFTYENNGRNFLSDVDIVFYISKNRAISTIDTQIGTGKLNLGRDDVSTIRSAVHIPNLTVGQTYWLGVIVDYKNKINEFEAENNAASIPIHVSCCN